MSRVCWVGVKELLLKDSQEGGVWLSIYRNIRPHTALIGLGSHRKHETLNQWRLNVGPASQLVDVSFSIAYREYKMATESLREKKHENN